MGFDAKTLAAAAELGLRLEMVNGLAIWEAQPVHRHQKAVERIAQSIRRGPGAPECTGTHALAVYVSPKRSSRS